MGGKNGSVFPTSRFPWILFSSLEPIQSDHATISAFRGRPTCRTSTSPPPWWESFKAKPLPVDFTKSWQLGDRTWWNSPWGYKVNGHFRIRIIGGTDSIYKAYFSGLNFREYPQQNMAQDMVHYGTVSPFQDPEIPIDIREWFHWDHYEGSIIWVNPWLDSSDTTD